MTDIVPAEYMCRLDTFEERNMSNALHTKHSLQIKINIVRQGNSALLYQNQPGKEDVDGR